MRMASRTLSSVDMEPFSMSISAPVISLIMFNVFRAKDMLLNGPQFNIPPTLLIPLTTNLRNMLIQPLYSTKNLFHIPNPNDTMNLRQNTKLFLTTNLLHIKNLLFTANLLVTINLEPTVRKPSRAQVPAELQGKH
jgi:hypothetical protein